MTLSFYGLIWRILPGPKPIKLVLAAGLILAALYVCFNWVFPQIADYMPFNDVTVE
ncbi:MAG: hypothetical protein LBR58_00740 [Propionibacteriaceae bacterium]|jgi:hypothetical protein|nr:hypothetical protein [Propionibacteriaceae bacterium]